MTAIKTWWMNLSNPVRAALNTTWQTFLATFGLALLGFVHDVQEWATNQGDHSFPAVTPLGKALMAAVTAAVAGLVTVIVRGVQASRDPAAVPQYQKPNAPP